MIRLNNTIKTILTGLTFLLYTSTYGHAQGTIDSLTNLIANSTDNSSKGEYLFQLGDHYRNKGHKAKADSIFQLGLSTLGKGNFEARVKILLSLGILHMKDPDKKEALKYLQKAEIMLDSLDRPIQKGHLYNNLSMVYKSNDEYHKALQYAKKSLHQRRASGDSLEVGHAFLLLGNVYEDLAKYPSALEAYFQGANIYREKDFVPGLININNNIALMHGNNGDYEENIKYLKKNIDLIKSIEMDDKLAGSYLNLANSYKSIHKYDTAMIYYQKALEESEKKGSKYNIGLVQYNKGELLYETGKYASSIHYTKKSLNIFDEINFSIGKAYAYICLGKGYSKIGETGLGLEYMIKGRDLCEKIGLPKMQQQAYYHLSDLYKERGNYKKAYYNHSRYLSLKDSILSLEKQKQLAEIETRYETEKKELQISNLTRQKALKQAEIEKRKERLKKETTQKVVAAGGLGLMLVFAFLIYRSYRQKKNANRTINKQKSQVERQKKVVEQKNREITDSISYAKRLQSAILPSSKYIGDLLPESFIFYQPKEIVAGDFYFMEKEGNRIVFAAADCTGHGVPGAMVSVVCHNALTRAVKEFKITQPAEILNKVNTLIEQTFEKSEEEVKDGMDIALCSFNVKTKELQYSGANNPLWIVRKGSSGKDLRKYFSAATSDRLKIKEGKDSVLLEIKADKQPIGKYHISRPFSNHSIKLEEGDMIYLFSDGFPDQFGGEKGKKLKYANFKKLLLRYSQLPLSRQAKQLREYFNRWKGDLEQIDDICIFGIRFEDIS